MIFYWLSINIMLMFWAVGFRFLKKVFSHSIDLMSAERLLLASLALLFIIPIVPQIGNEKIQFPIPNEKNVLTRFSMFSLPPQEKIQTLVQTHSDLSALQTKQSAFLKRLNVSSVVSLVLLINLIVWFVSMGKNVLVLRQLTHESVYSRQLGSVKILYVDKKISPLSYWLPGQFIIIMPSWLLEDSGTYRLAIKHELTHHRLGHSYYLWVLGFLQSLFAINPAFQYIRQIMVDHMEFQCDRHASLSLGAWHYAMGLVKVIDKLQCQGPNIALSMLESNSQLKRRITMLKISQLGDRKKKYFTAKLGSIFGGLFVISLAFNQTSASTSVTMLKFQPMVQRLHASDPNAALPVELNKYIVNYLKKYIDTPQGFDFVMKSKSYLAGQEQFLVKSLTDANLPSEMIAIPFVESGFREVHPLSQNSRSIGLWQFTPKTARQYGLIINDRVDDRYDVYKSTNAAIRYFQHLITIPAFKHDWRLAILSFNAGENNVLNAMSRLGTSDPWLLDVGDKDYLAKFMAALIILKRPELISFQHPLSQGKITSAYGPRPRVFGTHKSHFHSGIDIAASSGTPVKSSGAGVVIRVQEVDHMGKTVIIKHSSNIKTQYSHLKDAIVTLGQKITLAETLGHVGNTGDSTGPHVHYEVQVNSKSVDPLLFLSAYDVFGKN